MSLTSPIVVEQETCRTRRAARTGVVDPYDTAKSLGLTPAEKNDLVEYLKSL